MRVHKSSIDFPAPVATVRDRVLGEFGGWQDEALVFAASSVINELTAPHYSGQVVVRSVNTEARQYTLRGSRVRGPDGVQPVVLVFADPVESAPAAPPAVKPAPVRERRIHSRFRLTRKEELVAQLLAAKKTNEEIAAELCISPHTARHHTQSVLDKLGLRSRKEVVSVLRED